MSNQLRYLNLESNA